MTDKQVALIAAASYCHEAHAPADVMAVATKFLEWLVHPDTGQ